MEGGRRSGEGRSRRKRQAERRSSRQWVEVTPVEEEEAIADMEVEEEAEVPTMNVEEERKKRAKAMKSGEMRARVSWMVVLAIFLALPPFQRERVEEMGFSEVFRMERMRADSALTQALRSRWDAEATAFIFPWGHMIPSLEDVSRITGLRIYGRPVSGYTYPCYHDFAQRLLELPIEHRSSLVPRVPLQESLGLFEVGKVAGEKAFLAHQFDSLGASERQTSISGFFPFLQVWAYLHLPALGRGDLTRPGLVPIARRWDSRRDPRNLGDQLEQLQEAIDNYPYLDLREGDEGQPWLVQASPYFGRSVWLHALNLVLPLHLYLSQRSLGLRQSSVEFPQINNSERRGKAVKSNATTDNAYLQAYALKYGGMVYKSARHQVDVAGEVASLRALLYLAVLDREAVQRQTAELLAGAVLRAEEAQRHLEERLQGEVQTTRSERDQLRIRAEAAEAQVARATKELAALRVQRSPGDQEEVIRLRVELLAQQAVARSIQQIVTDIGRSRSRSRSRASVSRATGPSVGQYLAGSSSRQRNEEEERRRQGEGSAQSGRAGGEMPPPPDRQEGSEESGGSLNNKLTVEIKSSRSGASVSVSAFFFLPATDALGYIRWNIRPLRKARLCQGLLPAAAAAAVVVSGRVGTVVVVVVVVVAAAIAVVASDPVGPLRWRDLRVLALVLGRILTLRGLLFVVVPWLLKLLRVWRPTYWALGVADYTDLLIGLNPISNWALRLLDIMGFWGLKHGVY
ncbi:hypothetical protein Taro_020880, partial [Colocasia esculenta]|nr:hypothetical protein [Colocasia esculenta]